MRMRTIFGIFTVILLAGLAIPVQGATINKTCSFEMDKWCDISVTDGPATIHRIRLVEQTGTITKSNLFRPKSSDYLRTVQIQIEYSNSATKGWEARLNIEWLDSDGKVIDGYQDDEDMDRGESHDAITVTLSTLKYGIDVAKKLRVQISFGP